MPTDPVQAEEEPQSLALAWGSGRREPWGWGASRGHGVCWVQGRGQGRAVHEDGGGGVPAAEATAWRQGDAALLGGPRGSGQDALALSAPSRPPASVVGAVPKPRCVSGRVPTGEVGAGGALNAGQVPVAQEGDSGMSRAQL